uniref:NADH dehydrogenase subunit 9 n=1 Tax=Chloropicon maureeniae TaxID=1461542 RepID=A0A4D6C557_9CHLO|nr:NADH dehydrogenase subunit 9 [Chloropicon maureeniae]QBX98814.1 NADH dehydrogenase subunit 9 [Chloropicon maureeniae]
MDQFVQCLARNVPQWLTRIESQNGEIIVTVKPEFVVPMLIFLRDHSATQFKQLIELCGVDYPTREKRFEVVYELMSITWNSRARVKVCVDEYEGVSSVTDVYQSALWSERETWDLYGIYFHDHPDLRRILTDYGFTGHPLRKDFPLSGYTEVRYDDTEKRVIYEPVELTQEYRSFDFANPWDPIPQK